MGHEPSAEHWTTQWLLPHFASASLAAVFFSRHVVIGYNVGLGLHGTGRRTEREFFSRASDDIRFDASAQIPAGESAPGCGSSSGSSATAHCYPRSGELAINPTPSVADQDQDSVSQRDDAFLILQGADDALRNVFRLAPGTVMTVGRDPLNRIVLKDDRCSRQHCEVFWEASDWTLRDLQSRNGTRLNGEKVEGQHRLVDGDRIHIGKTVLLFTNDLAEHQVEKPAGTTNSQSPPATDVAGTDSAIPEIIERKSQSRYITESGLSKSGGETGIREALRHLYDLIMRMVTAQDVKTLSATVLDCLLPAVNADIGAVLLFPDSISESSDKLRIVAYKAPDGASYRVVSRRLSRTVLAEREAVLAMDIRADGTAEFQTLDGIKAESVICAPIRNRESIFGLLHVYSLDPNDQLDADALEFTLAVADQMAIVLERLNYTESLTTGLRAAYNENESLRRMLEIESELVGGSPQLQQLREKIGKIALSDATALVRGESGVGKELVARAIHFNSNRHQGPFVCLNCAALTETLLESELFGHEKGSFTGATEKKIGKFEQAEGGTLFLDEVGEMPLSIQAKFLRVLEGHSYERVGGSISIRSDVRVVAATNRNLEEAVESGKFRSDLFFRLQILEIFVPSLREHATDIPVLAEFFLDRCAARTSQQGLRLSPDAMEALCKYDWPGNVRELRNVIERAVVLADGAEIMPRDIHFSSLPSPATAESLDAFQPISLAELEEQQILKTLRWTKGNKREAARILGINRSTLDRKLERYEQKEQ